MKIFNKTLTILLAIITVIVFGCEVSKQDIDNINATNINNPELVCKANDGRILYRVEIKIPNERSHYMYYFGTNDTSTISVNYSTGNINEVFIIDGKTYKLTLISTNK